MMISGGTGFGNLPKCVFVGDKNPPVGPGMRDMAAFSLRLTFRGIVWQIFLLYWGGSGGV